MWLLEGKQEEVKSEEEHSKLSWSLHVKFKMKIKWKIKKNKKEKDAVNFNVLKEPRGILKCLEIVSKNS